MPMTAMQWPKEAVDNNAVSRLQAFLFSIACSVLKKYNKREKTFEVIFLHLL